MLQADNSTPVVSIFGDTEILTAPAAHDGGKQSKTTKGVCARVEPDLEEARRFLEALDPNTEFTFGICQGRCRFF